MAKLNIMKVVTQALAEGAGGIAAEMAASKIAPNMDPRIKGAALIALGAFAPSLIPRNQFVSDMAAGVRTIGAVQLAKGFIPGLAGVAGIGYEDPYLDPNIITGMGQANDDVIAG